MNFRGSGAGEKGDPGPVGIKGERGASAPSLPAEPIGKYTANVLYVVFTVVCLPTKSTNNKK